MNIMNVEKTTAEREFLEYLHGYPGEPEWLTALLYGKKCHLEPDIAEMQQVSKHRWVEMYNKVGKCTLC